MTKTKPRADDPKFKTMLASVRLNSLTYRKVWETTARVNSAAVKALCDGRLNAARRLFRAADRLIDVQLAADYAHVWR